MAGRRLRASDLPTPGPWLVRGEAEPGASPRNLMLGIEAVEPQKSDPLATCRERGASTRRSDQLAAGCPHHKKLPCSSLVYRL